MTIYNWPGRSAGRARNTGGTRPSPLFLLLVAVFALAAWRAWSVDPFDLINGPSTADKFYVFVMVAAGWVITLCLHEYGHALAAYRGGDKTVKDQGYLTLNPLKYTHPILSIVLPLVWVILGGIPLPGGAVYINHYYLRNKWWDTLVSAAGPIANALSAVVLIAILHVPSAGSEASHIFFWSGLAILAWFQIGAVILNLLPIPPLDGYGIIEPHLSPDARRIGAQVGVYGWFILFFLLWWLPATNHLFGRVINDIANATGLDSGLAGVGAILFKFWQH